MKKMVLIALIALLLFVAPVATPMASASPLPPGDRVTVVKLDDTCAGGQFIIHNMTNSADVKGAVSKTPRTKTLSDAGVLDELIVGPSGDSVQGIKGHVPRNTVVNFYVSRYHKGDKFLGTGSVVSCMGGGDLEIFVKEDIYGIPYLDGVWRPSNWDWTDPLHKFDDA